MVVGVEEGGEELEVEDKEDEEPDDEEAEEEDEIRIDGTLTWISDSVV